MRFKDKVVLVTGGGTGIGRAIALQFSKEGARVAVTGRREAPLEETIGKMDGEGMMINADVSSPEAVSRMVGEVVSKWGRLDVLVNNAATIVSRTNLGDTPVDAWDRMMDVNVRGVFLCCKEALAVMEKQGAGSIVNIASVSGQRGQPSNSAYSTSKGAIMNMTRSLAVDYGPKGIRINSVSPALVDTEMARTRLKPGEDWDERAAREWIPNYPLGRLGKPEDIAQGVLFLASDQASWITGIDLIMGGGLLAKL